MNLKVMWMPLLWRAFSYMDADNAASADSMAMIEGTSSSNKTLKRQGTYKIAIHGDDVITRMANSVASINSGVVELKNLCSRQRVLLGYISESEHMGLMLQLCVGNYCLTIPHLDRVPPSLKKFLAKPGVHLLIVADCWYRQIEEEPVQEFGQESQGLP